LRSADQGSSREPPRLCPSLREWRRGAPEPSSQNSQLIWAVTPQSNDDTATPRTSSRRHVAALGVRGPPPCVAPTTPTASDHRPSGNVSGSAVRNCDVNPTIRAPVNHPTIANVSGPAVVKSRPAHLRNFPKKIGSEPAPTSRHPGEPIRDGRGEFAMRLFYWFPSRPGVRPAINPASSSIAAGTGDRPRASSLPCLSLLAQFYLCASVPGREATYSAPSIDGGASTDHPDPRSCAAAAAQRRGGGFGGRAVVSRVFRTFDLG
jgi:hypothetical protein